MTDILSTESKLIIFTLRIYLYLIEYKFLIGIQTMSPSDVIMTPFK